MVDFEKFVKYSKAGPRYTSYPTAVEFSEKFGVLNYEEKLKSINTPLSLYFHLPFCRSACYFCGCNVVYTSRDEKKARYIEYVKKELKILAKYLNMNLPVKQLHFGGGTPTFFESDLLEDLIKAIKLSFPNFESDAEISCEIDPRFLDRTQMEVLAHGGFNRISFGVQDFDIKVQEAVHRVQSFDLTKEKVELAREFGIESINIDLIYGLPYQTLDSFKNTLKLVLELNANRLAIFNYAHVPWLMKTMRKIDETTLPLPSEKLKILKYFIDFLTSNGYEMVGMDHFAKKDDELFLAIEKGELHRNFQGYTTKGGATLIGVGLSSIGGGLDYYVQNYKDLNDYEVAIEQGILPSFRGVELNFDDMVRKSLILELMSNFKLNIKKLEAKFDINFFEYFKKDLAGLDDFIADELLIIDKEKIEITKTGSMIIRNIAMVFDAYLKQHENKKVFSKTV